MALSPREMDFIEAKNGAAREIALAFGVPPMLLGIPGDYTYANYAEANRAFYRQTVLPLLGRTAAAFGDWLAPVLRRRPAPRARPRRDRGARRRARGAVAARRRGRLPHRGRKARSRGLSSRLQGVQDTMRQLLNRCFRSASPTMEKDLWLYVVKLAGAAAVRDDLARLPPAERATASRVSRVLRRARLRASSSAARIGAAHRRRASAWRGARSPGRRSMLTGSGRGEHLRLVTARRGVAGRREMRPRAEGLRPGTGRRTTGTMRRNGNGFGRKAGRTADEICRSQTADGDGDGFFAGYASLFGAVDLGRDVVEPGAFAASLQARGAARRSGCSSSTIRPSRSAPGP